MQLLYNAHKGVNSSVSVISFSRFMVKQAWSIKCVRIYSVVWENAMEVHKRSAHPNCSFSCCETKGILSYISPYVKRFKAEKSHKPHKILLWIDKTCTNNTNNTQRKHLKLSFSIHTA